MPEFIHDENNENRIKDVGVIENCVYTLITMRAMKEHSFLYHLLNALVTGIIGYLAIDSAFGISGVLSLIAFFVYPALHAYATLYSPVICKALSFGVPLVLYGVRFAFFRGRGESFESFALSVMTFFMLAVISVVMTRAVMCKNTKLWCLVSVTACIVLFLGAMGVFLSAYRTGTVSVALLVEKLDGAIDVFSEQFKDALAAEFSDSAAFDTFKSAIPAIKDMTPEKAAVFFGNNMKSLLHTAKTLLPGVLVLICTLYGFLFTGVFSVVAKIRKIPLFVCIMDTCWCYRVPSSCITFFDIILLFVIIASIFGLPATVSAAVINLLIILLPVVTVCTFKAIHFFLKIKLRSRAAAYVICIVIGAIPVMFMGMWGYLFLCSLGVSLVAQRYRIEREAAKDKILHDTQAMLVLCGCKEISELKDMDGKLYEQHAAKNSTDTDSPEDDGENNT